jgi:hypothetical protein
MRLQDIIDRLEKINKITGVIALSDELDIFIKEMQDMENLTK